MTPAKQPTCQLDHWRARGWRPPQSTAPSPTPTIDALRKRAELRTDDPLAHVACVGED